MKQYQGDRLLMTALASPQTVAKLSLAQWEVLIRAARQTRLLARLHYVLERSEVLEQLPGPVIDQLHSAATIVRYHQRRALWELNRLRRILYPHGIPFILLKGSAYLLMNLELSGGREVRDVDLLIQQPHIPATEHLLRKHGWGNVKMDLYDQKYYREWMHELPPMRHSNRVTEVDLHHTILPLTSRLRPDPELLWKNAIRLQPSDYIVPAPHDLVLHCMVHLFYDGSLDRDLRDLFDIDGLLRHFATLDGFWTGLVSRAEELKVERPLYYSLHFTQRLLSTPVPTEVMKQARRHAPGALTRRLMDQLVPRALLPSDPNRPTPAAGLARWLLYLRSHWLRMPPLMLARHLFHKGVITKPKMRSGLN